MVTHNNQEKLNGNTYTIIPLTGGLGNQLFQYGFALFVRNLTKGEVRIDITLGNPRLICGQTSILNLELNQDIRIEQKSSSSFEKLYSKAYGWILSRKLKVEIDNGFIEKFGVLIAKLILCLKYRSLLRVQSADNLGYDANIKINKKNLLIGYFQTYLYSSNSQVFKELQSVKPKKIGKKHEAIRSEIENEKALLIHVRLTDYLKEQHFGIPSISYYEKSLNQIIAIRNYDRIWIASDDLMRCREILKDLDTKVPISYLDDSDLSDVEVWDLFRRFSGYIISNSSFSWWAAFLRKDINAPVFCPYPWFQGMEEPKSLIPPGWHRVGSL